MSNPLPVAVVLSGCGVNDGTEITEAVALIIALSEAGLPYAFHAPDREQAVTDHLSGDTAAGTRSILAESARIARGDIAPLDALQIDKVSALAFPGGFGAARNLTTFATDGEQAQLYPDVARVMRDALATGTPVLAMCAAPLVLGLAARDAGLRDVDLTVGATTGNPLAAALAAWGQHPVDRPVDGVCVDSARRLISVPAYMCAGANPASSYAAARAAVSALTVLAR